MKRKLYFVPSTECMKACISGVLMASGDPVDIVLEEGKGNPKGKVF